MYLLQYLLIFIGILKFVKSWPREYNNLTDGVRFDYIIVGAGTAGCVVANRLSDIADLSVLVIEAGGDAPLYGEVPGLITLFPHSIYDWDFRTEANSYTSTALKKESLSFTSGKMVGGSSVLNHLVWTRGKMSDFDHWDQEFWNWDTVLKYFKKSENMLDPEILNSNYSQYHGRNGPISLTGHGNNNYFSMEKAILDALQDAGLPIVGDVNGPEDLGYSRIQYSITQAGKRSSTAEAYLAPLSSKSKVFLLKDTLVAKILLDSNSKKATGVEAITSLGKTVKFYATYEVILSAGTFNSPKLLMLSGIGPRDDLANLSINILKDLPAVGRHLQDHVFVPLSFTGNFNLLSILQQILAVTHLNTLPIPSVVGYLSINDSGKYPPKLADIEHFFTYFGALSTLFLQFCTIVFNFKFEFCGSFVTDELVNELYFTFITVMHPQSRGTVRLRSASPLDPPKIESGYFTDVNGTDLKIAKDGLKYVAMVLNSTYFRNIKGHIIQPTLPQCANFTFGSEYYWECYILSTATTNFNPVGTCIMGDSDSNSVVNTKLKVHGINNLRVIDASVMPFGVSAETYAATVMIAERACDLIKDDYFQKRGNFK